MRLKILALLTLTTLFSLPLLANAATYNYYFSDDAAGNAVGDNTTGDGSIGNPWKTCSKAQSAINALSSSDTVNLYFDRGDTWTFNTDVVSKTDIFGLNVASDDPAVNIDAYGSGDKPKFDGTVTDFSGVPEHDVPNGPHLWSRLFQFGRAGCSIKNVEITGCYGMAVYVVGSGVDFTLQHCDINYFGGIGFWATNGIDGVQVLNNTFHTGQQLWRYKKRPDGWGGGVQIEDRNGSCSNNVVRYNTVYDIYGEAINFQGGVAEYNVIGDSYSFGLFHQGKQPGAGRTEDTIFRYNYIMSSNNAVYKQLDGNNSSNGICYVDELLGAPDNSKFDLEIYGNIIINRYMGLFLVNGNKTPAKTIKVYNNIVIDSYKCNYYISSPSNLTDDGYFYNNSSILYDRVGSGKHVGAAATFPHANWTVSNNHFYNSGDGLTCSTDIDAGWNPNCLDGDPALPGEPSVDWDGQRGPTYYNNIDFKTHLFPRADSILFDSGKQLDSGFIKLLLPKDTDFSSPTFEKTAQEPISWPIGPFSYPSNTSGPPASPTVSKITILPSGVK